MADLVKRFDLITVKAKYWQVPNGTIELKVASKDIDPSTLATIMEPVYGYLNDYRKMAIEPAIIEYDKKIADIREEKAAKSLEKQVNDELKKLVANLKKEAERRIQASWDKLKKENKAYTKFKLKIAATVTLGVFKVGKGIAALIATSGAKIDEYYKVAKSVVDIAKAIKKALDTEEKAREDLRKALESLAKAKSGNKVGKSEIKKVNDAIAFYNNKLTPIRQDAQSLAGKLQKLLELGDNGVELTAKQERKINEMLEQIIEFNTNEKMGRDFSKSAKNIVDNVEGKMDLKTALGYASKLKTAFDVAKKVFQTAAEIL